MKGMYLLALPTARLDYPPHFVPSICEVALNLTFPVFQLCQLGRQSPRGRGGAVDNVTKIVNQASLSSKSGHQSFIVFSCNAILLATERYRQLFLRH